MLRYLNMFVLIGIALIGISIAGFVTNNRFVTEPGQPINPNSSLLYLVAGLLMLINGMVSLRMAPPPPAPKPQESRDEAEAEA